MFRLPFAFIITGIISFMIFHFLTFADFAGWITTVSRSPDGWFHVHLIVLGWATMIAMGAVYQLANVVLQTELRNKKLGYIHYVVFTVGTLGLLAGFDTFNTKWIAAFATLAFAGIVIFTWNIGTMLLAAKQWNTITISMASAVIYLCLTGVFGMLMGLNFKFGFLGDYHNRIFGAHIWFGTIGWFGLLITGFSYKLLPMFTLAHDYKENLQKWVLVLLNFTVWTGVYGFLSGNKLFIAIGLFALITALLLYNIHIIQINKMKHKKTSGAGIEWAVWATRMLLLIISMGTAAVLYEPQLAIQQSLIVFILWAYLYGWVGVTILGYMSKIVPFLWWTYKYGPQAGKGKVPTMAQLLSEKSIHIHLSLLVICLSGVLIGLSTNHDGVTMISGMLLSVSAIVYIINVGLVFTK